jgi:cell division protease FtsH
MDSLNTGASNDIQQATDMARSMVMEYGMSEKLGWLRYRDNQEEVFLGHSVARSQSVSEDTARMIDQEVRRLVEEGEGQARQVLTDNLDELHKLATALLDYETLTGDEAKRAIKGEDIGRENPSDRTGPTPIIGNSIPKTRRPRGGIGGPAAQGA